MNRKNFLRQSAFAGTAALLSSAASAWSKRNNNLHEAKFNLDYAPHDGMFKASAGASFLDQIKFMYDAGFRSIEDNGYMDRPVKEQEAIGNLLAKLGMRMGVFVVNFDHWPVKTSLTSGNAAWREKFLAACREAVNSAKRSNAKWMTVVPGNYDRSLPLETQTTNVLEALKPACAIFEPHGLVMVLEALSDTPELFLRHSAQTVAICKALNSSACKFLFDMYHMQRNEGNIIANLDTSWNEIAYLQIGDNPGRKEPGTGEMNYNNIFKHIHNKGYKGILGMEHDNAFPDKAGEQALIQAYRTADNF